MRFASWAGVGGCEGLVGLFTLGTLGFRGAVWVFTLFICTGVLFTVVGVFTGRSV